MSPRTKTLLVGLILLLALPACQAAGPKTVALTESDAGREIELHEGDILEISLEGNPGTGYGWELAPGELSVLEQLGEVEFIQDKKLAGSPGRMILRFEAIAAGEGALQLVYHRPWETDVPPLKTFDITIVVQ